MNQQRAIANVDSDAAKEMAHREMPTVVIAAGNQCGRERAAFGLPYVQAARDAQAAIVKPAAATNSWTTVNGWVAWLKVRMASNPPESTSQIATSVPPQRRNERGREGEWVRGR